MVFTNFFEEASKKSASPQQSPSRKPRKRRRGVSSNKSAAVDSNQVSDKKQSGSNVKVKRQRKGPPSEQALALSARLKEFSSQKRMKDALELYWDESNDEIRDGHHACIVVDCCGRCGAIEEGEKIVDEMERSGMHVNVETKTALLKGYAHSGKIDKGTELFRSMCRSKNKHDYPNVRTLNTLLRGCLWTAATTVKSGKGKKKLVGGVATSDAAWQWFRKCCAKKKSQDKNGGFDCSSYEYYIAQLCYSLREEEAKTKIEEMKLLYHVTTNDNGELVAEGVDPSIVESLAVSLAALARAQALLGKYGEAATTTRSALNAAETAKQLMQKRQGGSSSLPSQPSAGGKRSWKKSSDGQESARRSVSDSLFRTHRLSEVLSEMSDLLTLCTSNPNGTGPKDLAFYLMTRLLYFAGGGTTDLLSANDIEENTTEDPFAARCQLMNATWFSFGLRSVFRVSVPLTMYSIAMDFTSFGKEELARVQEAAGMSASVLAEDCFIEFDEVFRLPVSNVEGTANSQRNKMRPLDIELGSGFGDWIVNQAIRNPTRDYVAVELRADRVAQTFSKAILNGSSSRLDNLCCVGAECGSFLRQRIRPGSVSSIFVNHPEPPTQTFGSNNEVLTAIAQGGSEPAHMLSSDTLISAANSLDRDGKLVIVTDNRWYARLICVTLLKVTKSRKGLLFSSQIGRQSGMRRIETFGQSQESIFLYEGQPSEAIGHSAGKHSGHGSSYFDRLWRSGAGTHAERKVRFIIVMERASERKKFPSSSVVGKRQTQSSLDATTGRKRGKKNRKRSEASQKRRNERRLLKRREAADKSGEAAGP